MMTLEVVKVELPLTALREGESGVITSIRASFGWGKGGGYGFQKRLMDMGLTPGTRITVVKSAPFHGPIEINVRGYRLVIGRGMAEKILVEVQK